MLAVARLFYDLLNEWRVQAFALVVAVIAVLPLWERMGGQAGPPEGDA